MDEATRARADGPLSLDAILAEVLARHSRGDADPLAAMCAEHPQHADELRRRVDNLRRLGLFEREHVAARERIGGFVLLRELGAGGMGQVWLAEQHEPVRRLVALKLVHERLVSGHGLARFAAERQALAQLNHPGIAQVFEAGATADGRPWYAMEFVDGQPLTVYCRARQLDVDARLRVFLQLCEAVQYAHQRGILHRDLKPGNVLVCERPAPLVKVIDFGLAKALERPLAAATLTEAGQILGTPEYMSPEQALPGPEGVDTRSDVYALGTMLYELLCGELPFDFAALRQQGFLAMQRAIVDTPVEVPSVRLHRQGATAEGVAHAANTTVVALVRRVRGDLDWIVAKALAKDRSERYAAVSELAADVRRHLALLPVHAGPPSTFYQLRRFVRRHRAAVAGSVAFVVGLLVALVVTVQALASTSESLDRFDTLQVVLDLDELAQRETRDLWPAMPERVPAMDRWLQDFDRIGSQLGKFERQRDAVAAQGRLVDGQWQFAAPREAFLHRQLLALLADLEVQLHPDGRRAQVAARREWASTLERRSLVEPAAAWATAIAEIADRSRCPAYDGLRIEPQLGLLPLHRDPVSGLWEFAFLQPGEELPVRGERGWVIGETTGMVFVLIPGGPVRLGIERQDPRLGYAPHDTEYGPDPAVPDAGHPVPVRLDPYFLSKYEMTQAQWQRLRLRYARPSMVSREREGGGVSMAHPVHTISNEMAADAMRRLGLVLPTSARWEHAARAGGDSPWWPGWRIEDFQQHENLGDRSHSDAGGRPEGGGPAAPFDDKAVLTSVVGSFLPNPFGLFDVLGNVREHTGDPAHKYKDALPRDGDGAMVPVREGEVLDRAKFDLRGGSYMTTWLGCRATLRSAAPVTNAGISYGVRPCRPVHRSGG